ncbi:hypothetical protein JW930_07325 [Candidatus Woesearchaeota archaeon]|nr:hypothetical protein [Candidatus Woesearchaeota archaeon]
MDDIKEKMQSIKEKADVTTLEKLKLVRYYINIQKYSSDKIIEELSHWDRAEIQKLIKDVEQENLKPGPKRYYVSLKEPLEDSALR